MNKRNESHCKQILKYLTEHDFITNDIAIDSFRCYRLSARIHDLRKRYVIETEMVYSIDDAGYPMKYAKYRLVA